MRMTQTACTCRKHAVDSTCLQHGSQAVLGSDRVSASENVAKAMATLIAACYVEATRPSAISTEIVEIASGHFATALNGFKTEIVADIVTALKEES